MISIGERYGWICETKYFFRPLFSLFDRRLKLMMRTPCGSSSPMTWS